MKAQTKIVAMAFVATLLVGCGSKGVSASGVAPVSTVHPVVIPQGTLVRIRTTTTLSTKEARTGQTALATLDAPLVVAGIELAPRGAEATLLIAESTPGGRVKGRAALGLRLTSLQMAGAAQPLTTNIAWHQARATKGKDAAKIAILGGAGAAIGALAGGGKGAAIGGASGGGAGTAWVLSTHGDAAVVPAESVIQFRLEQPLTVTVGS